ncbi:MAG: hypothetical protein ACTHZ9_07140 [Leucobacter sp.]
MVDSQELLVEKDPTLIFADNVYAWAVLAPVNMRAPAVRVPAMVIAVRFFQLLIVELLMIRR